MLNIIKSQLYSAVRDIYTYVCMAICILFFLMMLLTSLDDLHGEVLTGSVAFANTLNIGGMSGVIAMFAFASRLSGWDMNDKTINYEVLYGHKRSDIYWSRTIISMTLSTLIAAAFLYIPFTVAGLINGWGASVESSEAIKRGLLLIPTILRTNAIIIFLSLIFRNSWSSMLIGFLLYLIENIVTIFWEHPKFALFVTNLMDVMTFENVRPEYIDGKDIAVYVDTLSNGFVIGTIIVCTAETILLLLAGSILFRKRDMS